jgi:hypothetical protein
MKFNAKSNKNYGIFTFFNPICLVIYRKSENGESITKPLILFNCAFAVIDYFDF